MVSKLVISGDRFNRLFVADKQQKRAAARRVLLAGQRQRQNARYNTNFYRPNRLRALTERAQAAMNSIAILEASQG